MDRTRSVSALKTALAGLLLLTGCAQRQFTGQPSPLDYGPREKVEFSCPTEGLRTRTNATKPGVFTTWMGPNTADPVLCIQRPRNGREVEALYGWNAEFAKIPEARIAFASAFAGDEVPRCFAGLDSAAYGPHRFDYCFRQLGRTSINYEGAPKPVVAFLLSTRGVAGWRFSVDYTNFWDPALHLWIRQDVHQELGEATVGEAEGYERHVITD